MKERITFDSRTRQSQTGPVKRQRRPLSNEQKHKLWTNVVFVGLILFCHLLQNTPHMFPTIMGAHCFLLLPLTVCIAMFLHNLPATMLCLFAGVLWDVSAAHLDGFNAIFFLLSSTGVGLLMNYLMRNNLWSANILSALVILLYVTLHWLCFVVLRGVDQGAFTYISYYLPSALYSFAFTPVFYVILRRFMRYIRERYPKSSMARGFAELR
ncbi:MAG: rod shape-determining protein MreD [Clostridia bacterium]|nr:rod shape-determining protein MreD [Clostridia bacterium]MBQ2693168.1 rod shape-determining protein MreD [Clostridia bacterium]MBQ6526067.1 rod shape-determining protein MreD [Clostridia bacterium]MBQ7229051.1 rod shape-determining protein MreD [Clostridia bacterium]